MVPVITWWAGEVICGNRINNLGCLPHQTVNVDKRYSIIRIEKTLEKTSASYRPARNGGNTHKVGGGILRVDFAVVALNPA